MPACGIYFHLKQRLEMIVKTNSGTVDIGRVRNVSAMKIHVTNSKYPALVDEDVFFEASKITWHLSPEGYATTNVAKTEEQKASCLRLHELVSGKEDHEASVIIFLNGDRLDCRKVNLAFADKREAAGMAKVNSANTSGFKGVSWSKSCKKWVSTIGAGKSKRHLGVFSDRIDAAKSYDAAALKYYGEHAMTNKKMGLY